MSEFVYCDGELYHYGVPGMRWGVRRANRYRQLGDRYRAKAYGTGSVTNGTYKSPKNTSDSAYTKNIQKSDAYYKKADATMRKTYEKASKKLQKLDKKSDKALERARAKRVIADRKMDSLFSTRRGRAKANRIANKAMRDAVSSAAKARHWLNAMDRSFAKTSISLSKEQTDLGRKYIETLDKRTFR